MSFQLHAHRWVVVSYFSACVKVEHSASANEFHLQSLQESKYSKQVPITFVVCKGKRHCIRPPSFI